MIRNVIEERKIWNENRGGELVKIYIYGNVLWKIGIRIGDIREFEYKEWGKGFF